MTLIPKPPALRKVRMMGIGAEQLKAMVEAKRYARRINILLFIIAGLVLGLLVVVVSVSVWRH